VILLAVFLKKGKLLKCDTSDIDLQIKSLEVLLKEAKECLKDAKTDIERSIKLFKAKTISRRAYEDIHYLYTKCVNDVAIKALDVEYFKYWLKDYTLYAPYDLKVVKRILSIGSGVKAGRPILEVQKL
jgi:multidrug resistance efflux pump